MKQSHSEIFYLYNYFPHFPWLLANNKLTFWSLLKNFFDFGEKNNIRLFFSWFVLINFMASSDFATIIKDGIQIESNRWIRWMRQNFPIETCDLSQSDSLAVWSLVCGALVKSWGTQCPSFEIFSYFWRHEKIVVTCIVLNCSANASLVYVRLATASSMTFSSMDFGLLSMADLTS